MPTSSEKTNPEIDQDRVFDLFDTFEKHGSSMFCEQVAIYNNLAPCVRGEHVLEAGCGSGVGTAVLFRHVADIVGTDKLQKNVDFAKCIYPWIFFTTWDLNKPTSLRASVVVCIEAIEHVTDPQAAINHLIEAADHMVWLSTPNGVGKKRPPGNPYHTREYTPFEVLEMIGDYEVKIRHWQTWEKLHPETTIDPLVYQIQLGDD